MGNIKTLHQMSLYTPILKTGFSLKTGSYQVLCRKKCKPYIHIIIVKCISCICLAENTLGLIDRCLFLIDENLEGLETGAENLEGLETGAENLEGLETGAENLEGLETWAENLDGLETGAGSLETGGRLPPAANLETGLRLPPALPGTPPPGTRT